MVLPNTQISIIGARVGGIYNPDFADGHGSYDKQDDDKQQCNPFINLAGEKIADRGGGISLAHGLGIKAATSRTNQFDFVAVGAFLVAVSMAVAVLVLDASSSLCRASMRWLALTRLACISSRSACRRLIVISHFSLLARLPVFWSLVALSASGSSLRISSAFSQVRPTADARNSSRVRSRPRICMPSLFQRQYSLSKSRITGSSSSCLVDSRLMRSVSKAPGQAVPPG